jgi:hypothetical protein
LDLLVVYSDAKRGELVSLASLLMEKDIRFRPEVLPQQWLVEDSEALCQALRRSSHWLFLVADHDLNSPAFLFSIGYCLAVQERCFLLGSELNSVPAYWRTLIQVCPDFNSLVQALDAERLTWQRYLAQRDARARLTERGIDATNTAYLDAVTQGDLTSCGLFVQAGFSPNLANKQGVGVLSLAVRSSHLGVLRLLLDAGADMNQVSQDRGNTPVMDAAAEGLTEIAQELIQRGASLEGTSRNGQSVLVLAIGKGAQDIAGLLLDAGADPFVSDKLGMNASQYAQLLGRQDFLAKLKAKYPDRL